MTKTRIYAVKIIPQQSVRMVRAPNIGTALRHVASQLLYAECAKQETIVQLMMAGVKVEDATTQEQPSNPDANSPEAASVVRAVSPRAAEESGHPHSASCAATTALTTGSPAPAEESGRPSHEIPPRMDRRVPRQI